MRAAAPLSVLLGALLALPTAAQDVRFGGHGGGAPSKKHAKKGSDDRERIPAAERDAEAPPLAIIGGDIHLPGGETISDGTLLLRHGRIEAILDAAGRGRGRHRKLGDYEQLDASGLQVYPGLVAAGLDGIGVDNDYQAGLQAEALKRRIVDSYDAFSDNLQWAASAGITSALIYSLPQRSDAPLSCRADVLKISPGEPRGVLVKEAAAVFAGNSIFGPKGSHDLRKQIQAARDWRDEPAKSRKDDPAKQLVLDVADGRVPLILPASRKAQLTSLLVLAEEIGFQPIVYHSTDAWALAKQLADADIPVVQHVRTNWGKPRDDRRGELVAGWRHDAVARLHRAGVQTAVLPLNDTIMTWGVAGRDMTNYPMEAAFAQRGGLSAQEAFEAITIVPARIYGVDDRVGSIEVGKDADIILVDGDPLDYKAFVRKSIVNGRVVYDAATNHFWSDVVEDREQSLAGGS
jgi:hypothetical protein